MMNPTNGARVARDDIMSEGITSESEGDSLMDSPPRLSKDFDKWQSTMGLKGFGEGLNAAAKAIFPKTPQPKYSNVYVLMMVWEEEDSSLPLEISQLLNTFDNTFNFNVELWRIPAIYSQSKLNQRIQDFVTLGQNSDQDLKIVYYANFKKQSFSDDGEKIR